MDSWSGHGGRSPYISALTIIQVCDVDLHVDRIGLRMKRNGINSRKETGEKYRELERPPTTVKMNMPTRASEPAVSRILMKITRMPNGSRRGDANTIRRDFST